MSEVVDTSGTSTRRIRANGSAQHITKSKRIKLFVLFLAACGWLVFVLISTALGLGNSTWNDWTLAAGDWRETLLFWWSLKLKWRLYAGLSMAVSLSAALLTYQAWRRGRMWRAFSNLLLLTVMLYGLLDLASAAMMAHLPDMPGCSAIAHWVDSVSPPLQTFTFRGGSARGTGVTMAIYSNVDLWRLAGLAAPVVLILLARGFAAAPKHGLCPHCEYDLRGITSMRCPECGTAISVAPPRSSNTPGTDIV